MDLFEELVESIRPMGPEVLHSIAHTLYVNAEKAHAGEQAQVAHFKLSEALHRWASDIEG